MLANSGTHWKCLHYKKMLFGIIIHKEGLFVNGKITERFASNGCVVFAVSVKKYDLVIKKE